MAAVVRVPEIVDALEMQLDEQVNFLDRETGKVETVSIELLGLAEEGDEEPDLPAWQHREWEMAELIAGSDNRFLKLPSKFEVHDWQIMEDFADSQREPLRSDLLSAIRGGALSECSRIFCTGAGSWIPGTNTVSKRFTRSRSSG
jgi:hypothetical protein